MATAPFTRLTEEDYLRIERAAEFKSEFHDGEMFAMSGGSLNHSLLGSEALALIRRQCAVLRAEVGFLRLRA